MDYWHKRKKIPFAVKNELKNHVYGEYAGTLAPQDGDNVALLKVSGEVFSKVFTLNRSYLFRGDYTAPAEENNYDDDECFLTEDGLAGFSVSEANWLVSVFSNQPWRGFIKIIAPFVLRATKLVCIVNENDCSLVKAYERDLGFKTIAKTIDDTEIMTKYYGKKMMDDFVMNYGHPHHIFMYRPASSCGQREIRSFEDYFEAEAYVNREVK